jgi:hypothetical protein
MEILREDLSRSVLLRRKRFQKKVAEKIKTNILCLITFFSPEYHAVYEIMWKNSVELGRPQIKIWRMHIAC